MWAIAADCLDGELAGPLDVLTGDSSPQRALATADRGACARLTRCVIRRFEIIRRDGCGVEIWRGGCVTHGPAAALFDRLWMPVPPAGSYGKDDQFWFSEAGWVMFGRNAFDLLAQDGFLGDHEQLVLLEREHPDAASVSYRDDLQIAIRPPRAIIAREVRSAKDAHD